MLRLCIDISMKVAGLKILASISMPGRPGLSLASASSMPRVTSSVFAQGSFSTIIIKPASSLMTASPMSGRVPHFTVATSPISGASARRTRRSNWLIGTAARSSGVTTGDGWWMTRRWFGVSNMPSTRVLAFSV